MFSTGARAPKNTPHSIKWRKQQFL